MDVTRALAIILVVLIHAHEQSGVPSLVTNSLFYSIGRLGVPLFFMLSGALILPRAAEIEIGDYYKKYWKRILQFVILFLIYTVVTNFVYYTLIADYTLIAAIKKSITHCGLILGWDNAIQMWYMNVIISFYLFAPFIARLITPLSNKYLALFVIFLIPCFFPYRLLPHHCAISMFNPYFVYFVIGYLIINRFNNKGKAWVNILYFITILLCMGGTLMIDCIKMEYIEKLHWYSSSPSIFVGSIALLILLRNIFGQRKTCKWVTYLSKHSFGIFLVHCVFLYSVMKVIPPTQNYSLERVCIYTVSTLFLSWIFVALFSRIPYVRKLVM